MTMKPRVCAQVVPGVAERWVPSTCGLCSLGCGLDIAVDRDRITGVRGRADHPVGLGRLGPKGLAQWRANHHPSRGLVPRIRDASDVLVDASWDEAMAQIARRVEETIARKGAGAIAFYNSGQLLLEEYYTLAKLARAGIGTPNVDANTRLCTATVGEALMQSFGADGPPGCFADLDQTDCIVLFGHNAAEQSTVLWMRILAAKDGPRHPRVIAIDPRRTFTVDTGADLHLAPRPGTNLALINGLCREIVDHGWIDEAFVVDHTAGFDAFMAAIDPYTPDAVELITGVAAADLRTAAEWIGTSERTVTTCLQGVYQSNQATAVACAVNSMHLVMGKIGKPGSAPFQFAGQPSSMNTRECGADGSYPAYRNWANPAHMADLAKRWNVPVGVLGAKPVSAPEIFELAAERHVEILFVLGSNPAVSEANRIHAVAALRDVFLIVMDPFHDTETAVLADVYLPTAMWGEKTGCMTNAERRCNLVQRAVPPPGEARADLDILIELSRRLALADKDGEPLIAYRDARGAFEEWKRVSKGTIPDYSGMTYESIVAHGGLQWPCTEDRLYGTERLYEHPHFPTEEPRCESFVKDLETGHARTAREYAATEPHDGRARLISAAYQPAAEQADGAFPMTAISGRQAYHWHTRTKTAKAPELDAAAPSVFVSLHSDDAARLGIADGDLVRVESRRGSVVAPAKVGTVVPVGVVFVPFHYGELDRDHAANALTPSLHDPASKQPVQKLAAVRIERIGGGDDAWWRTP